MVALFLVLYSTVIDFFFNMVAFLYFPLSVLIQPQCITRRQIAASRRIYLQPKLKNKFKVTCRLALAYRKPAQKQRWMLARWVAANLNNNISVATFKKCKNIVLTYSHAKFIHFICLLMLHKVQSFKTKIRTLWQNSWYIHQSSRELKTKLTYRSPAREGLND